MVAVARQRLSVSHQCDSATGNAVITKVSSDQPIPAINTVEAPRSIAALNVSAEGRPFPFFVPLTTSPQNPVIVADTQVTYWLSARSKTKLAQRFKCPNDRLHKIGRENV